VNRLKSVGLVVTQDENCSDTICLACERKLKTIEDCDNLKTLWAKNLNTSIEEVENEEEEDEPSPKRRKIEKNNKTTAGKKINITRFL